MGVTRGDFLAVDWGVAVLLRRLALGPVSGDIGDRSGALGALASRFPNQTLAYDAKSMTFPDFPEANKWVRTDFREGWAVDGLSS